MTDEMGCTTQESVSDEEERAGSAARAKVSELLTSLSGDRFHDWYQERQYRQNIENGTPYFNGPASVPDPERHSPSKLLNCHRKVVYQQCNAPEESADPDGIFWFGSRFEEDIVFPFLKRAVTDSETYVQNSIWVDVRVETKGVELQLKGETDPVIVDADGVPLLPTEIKTRSSVSNLSSPNRTHRAQLHAYMHGLSEKYDRDVREGVLLYGSRDSLDVKIFNVKFDDVFWNDAVLGWAAEHTEYRLQEELPPPNPEVDWECKFCPYRARCGKSDREFSDSSTSGLLPLFTGYPREKVVEYLRTREDATLTPSLAYAYPSLADTHGVSNWHCSRCGSSYPWDHFDWNGDVTMPPRCPECAERSQIALLSGPRVDTELQMEGRDD